MDELASEAIAEESGRLAIAGTRAQSAVDKDKPFRERFVEMCLRVGIPLTKSDAMRNWVEHECNKSLSHSAHLRRYIPALLKKEELLQEKVLESVEHVGIIFDATPCQGDFFALIERHVNEDKEARRATARQQLIHCAALKGSLNAYTLAGEVATALQGRRLKNEQAVVSNNDGCYTNGAAINLNNRVADATDALKRFASTCLSHCASNAGKCMDCCVSFKYHSVNLIQSCVIWHTTGDEAHFVQLDLFWTLIQKVFSMSDAAKEEWFQVTGTHWPTYSEIRWYSKYEVLEVLFKYFPDMERVMIRVARKGISPRNSSKLLKLLYDDCFVWYLKIQLSAYIETLADLRNLCYFLEGDGTDMPFKVGERLDLISSFYEGGRMRKLPSTKTLIMHAIDWAVNTKGYTPTGEVVPARPTVREINEQVAAQVRSNRPRRQTAVALVCNAALAVGGETVAQRERREEREAAQRAIEKAEEKEAEEEARIAALQKEADTQADRPPTTIEEWEAIIFSGVSPSIEYFLERVNNESGDRWAAAEFFRGARIFDPTYAAKLSHDQGIVLIEKMRYYHIFNNGDNTIIDRLKSSWKMYQKNALRVVSKLDYGKDKSAILSWHYRMYLRQDEEHREDLHKKECRYCKSVSGRCRCNANLRVWWEAAKLAVLVMPSSGAAERVFSLLNNLFKDQQGHLFTDAIFLSLYLSYNKRELVY